MHPLHEYVARSLSQRLKARRVVIWYDPRREFAPFVAELQRGGSGNAQLQVVTVGGAPVRLAEFGGSYYELRAALESAAQADEPEALLVYLPGCERDPKGSVLMELEKSGECYNSQLKRLARNVLRERFTDGDIDELLGREGVTYEDLARAAASPAGADGPSILKGVFADCTSGDAILAMWVVRSDRDAAIESKQAIPELAKLIRSRLGFEPPATDGLSMLRARTQRYVLFGEFRSDLGCDEPTSVASVPGPRAKEEVAAVREFATRLRSEYRESYPEIADRVEAELGLPALSIPAAALGSIDTFRFEERALLAYCGELIVDGKFDEAEAFVTQRENGFWLQHDLARKRQWAACREMAKLGRLARDVRAALTKAGTDPSTWVARYVADNGWYRLDQAQRHMEFAADSLEEHAPERPLALVRRSYEDACQAMAEGFSAALIASGWNVPGVLHQTRVFSDVVTSQPRPVAYFLVDAMRYEMAVDLASRLPADAEWALRPAITALPSITPVGMAALLPGAAASFSIDELDEELGAYIDGEFLTNRVTRGTFAASRIPGLLDLNLDEVLRAQPSKLAKRVSGAQVVVVHSQEIDQVGEAGLAGQARGVMDNIIANLARAIRDLSRAGVAHFVVTADHGHLFVAEDRDESMRIDPPRGATIDLHRRCWVGRGGATPSGCVRASAAALGYSSDLEFVFPRGAGVFRSGGNLAFHHGGISLQEMVIPVLTVRLASHAAQKSGRDKVLVRGEPSTVTNRIFSFTVQFEAAQPLLTPARRLRVALVSGGREVGVAVAAAGADLDTAAGELTLRSGQHATVGLLLRDDNVAHVRVVVQDVAADLELYRSAQDIPVSLGV